MKIKVTLLIISTVLVQGPYLVRSASVSNNTLEITGDIETTTSHITIFAPSVSSVKWNGEDVLITAQDGNFIIAAIDGSVDFTLPSLGPWKWHDSLPEIQLNYTSSSKAWISKYSSNIEQVSPAGTDHIKTSCQRDQHQQPFSPSLQQPRSLC